MKTLDQLPRKVLAQAVVLMGVISGIAAFGLHAPCRNSNYAEGVFSSLCYSDFAVVFAEPSVSTFNQFAPTTSLLAQLVSALPFYWVTELVIFQLFLWSGFLLVATKVIKSTAYPKFTALAFISIPAFVFVLFVSDSIIGVGFATLSLLAWHAANFRKAGVFAGLALASGMWTWVLLLAYFVYARRFEALHIFRKVALTAVAVAVAVSALRFTQGSPLLIPVNFNAGEGTPQFVWALLDNTNAGSNLVVTVFGAAALLALAQYFDYLPFDFQLEPMLVVFLSISLITSISISPQHLIHLLWVLPLWRNDWKLLLSTSVIFIGYTIAVWLRFEAGQENARGIPDVPYALFAIGLWITLFYLAKRAYLSMSQPGIDSREVSSVH